MLLSFMSRFNFLNKILRKEFFFLLLSSTIMANCGETKTVEKEIDEDDDEGLELQIDEDFELVEVEGITVVEVSPGVFRFTPEKDFTGEIEIVFEDEIDALKIDRTIFKITVNPVNDSPVGNDDTANVIEAQTVTGNVLTNDTDVDQGDTKAVQTPGVIAGKFGTLTLNADGTYSYVANADVVVAGETKIETFTYTVIDSEGATDDATLSITISNADPVALPISGNADTLSLTDEMNATSTLIGNILNNDIDPNDLILSVKEITLVNAAGTALVVGDQIDNKLAITTITDNPDAATLLSIDVKAIDPFDQNLTNFITDATATIEIKHNGDIFVQSNSAFDFLPTLDELQLFFDYIAQNALTGTDSSLTRVTLTIDGQDNNDVFLSGNNDETIDAGIGDDIILTNGNNMIKGGLGDDYIDADFDGAFTTGADVFVYDINIDNGRDTIKNFEIAKDTLRFENVLDTNGMDGLLDEIFVEDFGDGVFNFLNASEVTFATLEFELTTFNPLTDLTSIGDFITDNPGLQVTFA